MDWNIFIHMHYLIYKITNKLNNKIYVGKHKTDNPDDDYLGSGLLIERAVEKYGREHFSKEIICRLNTLEEMNDMEAKIVDEEFIARDDTYNLKLGGQGGWADVIPYTKSSRKEVGRNNWKIGIDRLKVLMEDEEYRLALFAKAKAAKELYCSINGVPKPWLGRTHTEETKKKMSASKKGTYIGKKNPAYGTMWITNGEENRKIKATDSLPENWKKGRRLKGLP